MGNLSRRWLVLLSFILAQWLIVDVLSLSFVSYAASSLIICIICGVMLRRQWRPVNTPHHARGQSSDGRLPPEDFQGVVVLVMGDGAPWFSPGKTFRDTPHAWYLLVNDAELLPMLAQQFAVVRPELVPRILMLLAILPEHHTTEAHFQQALHIWQRAIVQCSARLNGLPPIMCVLLVTPPLETMSGKPLWFSVTPELPDTHVFLTGRGAMPVATWLQENVRAERLSRLNQALWLGALQSWYDHKVFPLLSARVGKLSVLPPAALGFCLAPVQGVPNNLWQQEIAAQTALSPSVSVTQTLLPLPEGLLCGLSGNRGVSRRMQTWRTAGLIIGVFLLLTMLASFLNNQQLVRSVGDHLALYQRLDGHPPAPKALAQQRLRADGSLLQDWRRQGEPLRYGLGLYQGMRLIAPVEAALSDWAPPAPADLITANTLQEPKAVRLDSVSLFDAGKSTLKSGSIKMLVSALVGIKAKPGWLIVIAGHTDNTGHPQLNQSLSLKRAESIRDWLRDAGDVSESCFAVQGYGESRPVATNDTSEGRALNRRVDVSLVPQANACPQPDKSPTPSLEDGAFKISME